MLLFRALVVATLFVICIPEPLVGQVLNGLGRGTDSLRPKIGTEKTDAENAVDGETIPSEKFVLRDTSDAESDPLGEIRASLTTNLAGTEAIIRIEVGLAPGCHIYSLTQDDPRQTRIDISQSPYAKIAGPAQPSRKPDPVPADSMDPAESYSNQIEFIVPLHLSNRPDGEELIMLVRINGMVCSDKGFCLPIQDQVIRAVTQEPVDTLPLQIHQKSETADKRDSGYSFDR